MKKNCNKSTLSLKNYMNMKNNVYLCTRKLIGVWFR